GIELGRGAEVVANAIAQALGLADVERLAARVLEQVDAGLVGQRSRLVGERLSFRCRSRVHSRPRSASLAGRDPGQPDGSASVPPGVLAALGPKTLPGRRRVRDHPAAAARRRTMQRGRRLAMALAWVACASRARALANVDLPLDHWAYEFLERVELRAGL